MLNGGAVYVVAMVTGFDRERVFYPTLLIVVRHYYILFAAIEVARRYSRWNVSEQQCLWPGR